MVSEDKPQPTPERIQTDESLRVEREKADDAIAEKSSEVEEADARVEESRARTDAALVAARAKTDRVLETATTQSAVQLERDRTREDEALRGERSDMDEVVRAARAGQSAQLSSERRDTDEALLEERACSDDAVATRDEFLGIVSHDLRNMLASVMAFAALIERAEAQENHLERVRMLAQRIQRSGDRMKHLIGDLVDVASIEAGALAVTCEIGDPAAVAIEAVEAFQTQAAAVEISLVPEAILALPLVPLDSVRILQVLTNLLSNAIKFTPPKGRVVLHVERVDDEIRFGVHDTGVGIAADKLEAIFERFYQLTPNDRRGVGLGLYISKCIVQGHGGRIWAESELGEGTTFYFTVPITPIGPRSKHLADVDVEPDVVIGR